jgi:uncharacterized protein YjbJ (UPF0337 family)
MTWPGAQRRAATNAGRLATRPQESRSRAPSVRCGERNSISVRLRICWVSGKLMARDTTEEPKMGEIKDKTRNAAQEVKGKAKEAAGKSTGNRKLESKGKTDQTKAKVKKKAEKVKDVFR